MFWHNLPSAQVKLNQFIVTRKWRHELPPGFHYDLRLKEILRKSQKKVAFDTCAWKLHKTSCKTFQRKTYPTSFCEFVYNAMLKFVVNFKFLFQFQLQHIFYQKIMNHWSKTSFIITIFHQKQIFSVSIYKLHKRYHAENMLYKFYKYM